MGLHSTHGYKCARITVSFDGEGTYHNGTPTRRSGGVASTMSKKPALGYCPDPLRILTWLLACLCGQLVNVRVSFPASEERIRHGYDGW